MWCCCQYIRLLGCLACAIVRALFSRATYAATLCKMAMFYCMCTAAPCTLLTFSAACTLQQHTPYLPFGRARNLGLGAKWDDCAGPEEGAVVKKSGAAPSAATIMADGRERSASLPAASAVAVVRRSSIDNNTGNTRGGDTRAADALNRPGVWHCRVMVEGEGASA